nr:hypothetical protein [Candidatus Sigynarchaeota archaeon]
MTGTELGGEPIVTCFYEDLFPLEDKVIYLYFHAKAKQMNLTINKIKEQKLFFLSLCRAYNAQISLTRIEFKRYHHGPFAKDLYNLAEFFSLSGWLGIIFDDHLDLENPQEIRQLNENGMGIFDELEEFFEEQKRSLSFFDSTLAELGEQTGKTLMDMVYKITFKGTTIESMPFDHVIPTIPLKPKYTFKIPKDWEYTIKFLLNPGNKKMLDAVCDENAKAKSTIWTGVPK